MTHRELVDMMAADQAAYDDVLACWRRITGCDEDDLHDWFVFMLELDEGQQL